MWGGIKGAVPIVLTYPAAYGLDPNGNVFNIIFFAGAGQGFGFNLSNT